MKIDSESFSETLKNKFQDNADVFNNLISFFLQDVAAESLPSADAVEGSIIKAKFLDRFNAYMEDVGYPTGYIFDYSYELFNYFCSFFEGGLYGLYKFREPHWEGPKVVIREKLKIDPELKELGDPINVFRGLSLAEHTTKDYGQSWTSDYKTALGFAERTQKNKLPSGVVKAKVNPQDVYCYISSATEFELIIDERKVFDIELLETTFK